MVAEHEHLTADEIVIEGRVFGRHVGEFRFAPTWPRRRAAVRRLLPLRSRRQKLTSERAENLARAAAD
jgi:hypothetical protein